MSIAMNDSVFDVVNYTHEHADDQVCSQVDTQIHTNIHRLQDEDIHYEVGKHTASYIRSSHYQHND